MAIEKNLKLFETTSLFGTLADFGPAATLSKIFSISTGSRLSFTLYILEIDPGTTVTFRAKTSFSLEIPFDPVLTLTASTAGPVKGVLTDFHNLMEMSVQITGTGTATFAVGLTVADNALATRVDIETAEIEVQINHQNDAFGRHSSTRIGDGVDEMAVNPDGSINTHPVLGVNEAIIELSGDAPSVASGAEIPLLSYTVPVGKTAKLLRLDYTGTNVSTYRYYKNGDLIHWRITAFGAPLSGSFIFAHALYDGIPLEEGDVVDLKVIHSRPSIADYSARAQILEIT